jgi:4-hydroxythreonine-4-phosphate dehydrogenase
VRDFVILADDLTGAADTAAMFASEVTVPTVYFGTGCARAPMPGTITAYSLATRDLQPEAAEMAWKNLAPEAAEIATTYLKVDSTLRGNVYASMLALSRATNVAAILLCPAFPQQHRGVRGDWVLVDGREHLNIPDLLRSQGCTNFETVSSPGECLALLRDNTGSLRVSSPLVLVASAESEGDLAMWANLVESSTASLVPAGSAGLACALAALRDLERSAPVVSAPAGLHRRMIFVIGSVTAVSRNQCRRLRERSDVRQVSTLPFAPEDWTAGDMPDAPHLLWTTHDLAKGDVGFLPAPASLELPDEFTTLVLAGGDTAERLLAAAGCSQMSVVGHVSPGIAATEVQAGRPWNVILKSGSFGDEYSLCQILDTLVTTSVSV